MGTRLKIVFPKASSNPLSEKSVGFSMLKVWAQPLSYFKGVVNHETPLQACHQREDQIDKLLIANG